MDYVKNGLNEGFEFNNPNKKVNVVAVNLSPFNSPIPFFSIKQCVIHCFIDIYLVEIIPHESF
jgi:glycopeptide antibiotics resistance protein